MADYTIHSSYKPSPPLEEKLISNILIHKANDHARNGKTNRILDSITGESYDFESFDKLTRNVASAFYKRGLRNGDVVIYMTYDIVKLQIFQTGVWRANGIVRASYPEDDEGTILSRVEESRVGWIYCEPEAVQMCLSIASKIYWDVEIIVTGKVEGCTSIYDLMKDNGEEMPVLNQSEEDPVLILNTSGTTGLPKGAVISHAALVWSMRAASTIFLSDEKDGSRRTNLIIVKGTHITGCLFPLAGILEGCELIVMHSIREEYMFQAVNDYKPQLIFSFPTLLIALINHPDASNYDFTSLRVAGSGGAPEMFLGNGSVPTFRRIEKIAPREALIRLLGSYGLQSFEILPQPYFCHSLFNDSFTHAVQKILMQLPNLESVINCYGLTEVAPVMVTRDLDAESYKAQEAPENAVGKLFPSVSAQFRNVETGEILGPNQIGELCVKCDGLFTEYLNNPKATEAAFVDGFFKTGDIGYYDENEFIFLIDRAKEIFKYLGNHVSPTEIENIINDHPSVGEVCVIGVPDPNGGGHVPRAFCVNLQDSDCTPEEIAEFANSKLAGYKHLRGGVYFVKQLPKGKTGKVSKQLVEQLELV